MRIFLIGYMGSGKSRLGRAVAASLGYGFTDLDEAFEERYHISIPDFFEKYGETVFRSLEKKILQEMTDHDEIIISTGGGTPCFFDNLDFIKKNGISIFLRAEVGLLVRRLSSVRKKRPLLQEIRNGELADYITKQLEEREKYYLQADFILSGDEISEEGILKVLNDVIPGNRLPF
jgi:shikimate kinase